MAPKTEVEAPKNPADQSVAPSEGPASITGTLPSETHSASEPPPSRAGRFIQSNPRARFYVIAVILVLMVASIFAWRYFQSYESTDDAQVDGHLMPLSARVGGYVTKVNVDDNQYVTAGTVLVEIDPSYISSAAVSMYAQSQVILLHQHMLVDLHEMVQSPFQSP